MVVIFKYEEDGCDSEGVVKDGDETPWSESYNDDDVNQNTDDGFNDDGEDENDANDNGDGGNADGILNVKATIRMYYIIYV